MISKELAKAVLGHDKSAFYSDGEILCITINIHELAHKCKVWANENSNISLGSYFNKDLKQWQSIIIADIHKKGMLDTRIEGNTEPEAIFAACEWVLKESNGHLQNEAPRLVQ